MRENQAHGTSIARNEPKSEDVEGYCAVMDIDVLGTFTMSHAAVKYLKQGGQGKGPSEGGAILNISATLHYTATWYQIHVSAAKVQTLVSFH